MMLNINLEAYVGVLLSIFIMKSGIDFIKESVDNMLGTRVSKAIKKDTAK